MYCPLEDLMLHMLHRHSVHTMMKLQMEDLFPVQNASCDGSLVLS